MPLPQKIQPQQSTPDLKEDPSEEEWQHMQDFDVFELDNGTDKVCFRLGDVLVCCVLVIST